MHRKYPKNSLIFCTAFILFLISAQRVWGKETSPQPIKADTEIFTTLLPQFKSPGKEFRPAPLWVWNADMNKGDIDRMLTELQETGFGGAFIHPRAGLITEYLSDDWFNLYKYAVEKGKELGLEMWIYDENSYPSGFAGGLVPEAMPESYNQGCGLALRKDTVIPENTDNIFICLAKGENNTFTDITDRLADYKNKKGDYYLYRKTYYARTPWYAGYSYVDLLLPGVTEKFLEVTMDGYEKNFGQDLGKSLKGIFSDEPHIGPHGGTRWTPALFDEFRKDWGYDLKEKLPMLSEDIGNWREVRHNYISTLTRLFIKYWAEPMAEYCRKHNLLWTGHYWEHDFPRISRGGDSMSMYARHTLPAIDMLFNQYNDSASRAQFGNIRSVRELSSVANQIGQKRTLSETYGGGGWDETFMDFKRLGDWEYALGVNFMCQHLSHTTIRGARKFDYPPVFSAVSPWWDNYKVLNDYFARLSLLLSHGSRNNDVLVIEPSTTIWSLYSYTQPLRGSKVIATGQEFQNFITKIEKQQLDYDLGSELMMEDFGSANEGVIRIGNASYHTVILPPGTENLNSATFEMLNAFINAGGELIVFSTPTLLNGAESPQLKAFFKNPAIKHCNSGNFDETIALLKEKQPVKIDMPGNKDLYCNHRSFQDGELIFLANASTENDATGKINIAGEEVWELNPMTGKITPVKSLGKDSVKEIGFSIPPAGSLTLFSSKASGLIKEPGTNYGESVQVSGATSARNDTKILPEYNNLRQTLKEVVPESPVKVFPEISNVITLDFCDLSAEGRVSEGLYAAVACDSLFGRFNRKNPWDSSVQFKRNTLASDTIKSQPISVKYYLFSEDDFTGMPFTLVQEFPDIWKVRVNGKDIQYNGDWAIDPRFGSYDITGHIVKGRNEIELRADSMNIFTEISPVLVFGDFTLKNAEKGWTICRPTTSPTIGSWKDQGYQCYPWKFNYQKKYNLKNPAKTKDKYYLELGKWNGTVAEAWVNGKKAGVFINPPYNIDITPFLQSGENTVEVKVTGSLLNLYGPHYEREQGLAAPPNWKSVKQQKPGAEYDQADYGLMEDFKILRGK